MARLPRCDGPDTWHHVMNRGIARRTLFENAADIRYFLAQLAWAVRRGEIEVHAYSILTTHYHLLVRSPIGQLGRVMQQVQTKYSRRFNRGRRRDGSLVRGRYGSKPVLSTQYRRILVRYIDQNPVQAGLCIDAVEYPHGSASHYARLEGPPWLERSWIEEDARRSEGTVRYQPRAYAARFAAASPCLNRLVEMRERARGRQDELDDLVGAAPPRVLEWMRRKAALADGTSPGLPVSDPQSVDAALRAVTSIDSSLERGRLACDARRIARVGLERELCASTFEEIGQNLGVTATAAWKLHGLHRKMMAEDEGYAGQIASLAFKALGNCHDDPGSSAVQSDRALRRQVGSGIG